MSFRSRRPKVASASETSEPQVDLHETFYSMDENVNLADDDDDHVDNGGQRIPWNNKISFKEDDVVQTIDSEGKISERKGTLTSAHVWCLDEGVKIVAEFNEYKQPVGKGGHILVRFPGTIAKTGELCPIGKASWHHVDDFYKVEIIKLIRRKFNLPNHAHIGTISHVGDLWRTHKSRLKKEYFDPQKSQQQNACKVPPEVDKQQWIDLVAYWCSPQGKKLSNIGKASRAAKAHYHTTGSVSFAQKKYQFKKKFKREPSNLEFMKITHERKDGSYVKDTKTQELMDAASSLVEERMVRSPEKSKEVIENVIFNELMYDDEVHNQRVVGYGFGVSRSQVFGLKAQLRNLAFVTHDSTLTEEFLAMKQENAKLKETCTRLESFSSRVTMILSRFGVNLNEDPFSMETNNQDDVGGIGTSASSERFQHSVKKNLNKNNKTRQGCNHKIKDNANTSDKIVKAKESKQMAALKAKADGLQRGIGNDKVNLKRPMLVTMQSTLNDAKLKALSKKKQPVEFMPREYDAMQ